MELNEEYLDCVRKELIYEKVLKEIEKIIDIKLERDLDNRYKKAEKEWREICLKGSSKLGFPQLNRFK